MCSFALFACLFVCLFVFVFVNGGDRRLLFVSGYLVLKIFGHIWVKVTFAQSMALQNTLS